ncbi:MAG: nitroreductase family protein [Candidatus Hodarchaeota archaeon]
MIDPEVFLKFLKERRSIRSFQNKSIPENEIEMILEAGRWTPSASHRQPWEFIVIKNKEILKEISKNAYYGYFIEEAPVAIAIVGKNKTSPNWYIIDTSLASMNMMLMAWSLGIGTCWIGALNRGKVKTLLGLGGNDYLLTVLPFGYIRGEIPEPKARKSLNKIVKKIY